MVHATVERVIDLPVTRAWELLSDYPNIHKIHPMVASVDQLSPNPRGLDAVRVCHFYDGGAVTERITAWDDNARSYTLTITEASIPVKTVAATLKAAEDGQGKTRLTAEMDLVAKYGFIGRILEVLVFKPKFGAAIGNLFAGIEHYAKTGEEIPKGFVGTTPAIVK